MMDRSTFCLTDVDVAASVRAQALFAHSAPSTVPLISADQIARIDRERILGAANKYLSQHPVTITASASPRSHGGVNLLEHRPRE